MRSWLEARLSCVHVKAAPWAAFLWVLALPLNQRAGRSGSSMRGWTNFVKCVVVRAYKCSLEIIHGV